MFRLFLIIALFVAPTLAGIFMIVSLVSGLDTLTPILVAAGLGALVGLPVSWKVAGMIRESQKKTG